MFINGRRSETLVLLIRSFVLDQVLKVEQKMFLVDLYEKKI